MCRVIEKDNPVLTSARHPRHRAKYAPLSPLQCLSRLERLIWGQLDQCLELAFPNPHGRQTSIPTVLDAWRLSLHPETSCPQSFLHARVFLLQQMVSCEPPPQPRRVEAMFSQTPALSQAGKSLTRTLWRGTGPCAPIHGVINDCCQCDMNAHIEKPCSLSPSLSGRQLLLSLKLLGVTHVSPLS